MKKLLTIFTILLLIPIAIAQDEEEEESPGTLPDSPFYGLKIALERINLALTFDRARKAEKRLLQAQRRLQEVQIMIEQKKIEAAEKAQKHHDKLLEKIEELEITDPEKAAKIQEKFEAHQQKLEQVKARILAKKELKEQERVQIMLNSLENRTKIARQQAITSISRNIEKLQVRNKTNQQNAIQALTRVREKLQAKIIPPRGVPGTPDEIGVKACYNKDNPNVVMTLENAKKIALSNDNCVEYELNLDSESCNKNSGTWWFNLENKTDLCNYACVVYVHDESSVVYPMCTGLIIPGGEIIPPAIAAAQE